MAAQQMFLGPRKRSIGRHRAGAERPVPPGGSVGGQVDRGRLPADPPDAAEPTGRSRSGFGRVNNEARARRLLGHKLEYVYDRGFDEPDAEATFLAPMPAGAHEVPARPRPPTGLSPYLASLYGNATLLRPEQEASLFLRMNYLKYRASKLLEGLDPVRASTADLDEIERLQREALAVKNRIVHANLRLVVSFARRRAGPDRNLSELLSEGNLTLLLAVERFDASRGFRFSTYASCAIIRNLARATGLEGHRRHRFVTGYPELFESAADPGTDEHGRERGRHGHQEAVWQLLGLLSDRERRIIISRFGLEGAREQTLRQLGEELGISKERVRQIESRARQKLRKLALEQGLDPAAA
jgi:RNA polymerase primary sigma factor